MRPLTKEYTGEAEPEVYSVTAAAGKNAVILDVPSGADADYARYTMTITTAGGETVTYDGRLDDSYAKPYNPGIYGGRLAVPLAKDWYKMIYTIDGGEAQTVVRYNNNMPTVASDASGIYAVTLEDYRGNVSETVVFSVKDGAIEEFDKTELLAAIAEAEKVDTSLYTEESAAALTAALADAKTVADTFYAMPDDIQAACDALNATIKGLELLPEEPGTSEEPGNNAQTGDMSMPLAAVTLLLAAGCAVVVLNNKKRERI